MKKFCGQVIIYIVLYSIFKEELLELLSKSQMLGESGVLQKKTHPNNNKVL